MSEVDFSLLNDLVAYNKDKYYHFKNYLPFESNEIYERMLSARYMKVSRLKRRLLYLVFHYDYLYFVTFTFDDYYLNKSDRTHKRLINNSLYSFDPNYKIILNADYGKETERLHFHAIIGTNNNSDLSKHLKCSYPCFTKVERISVTSTSVNKVSKYINKLSNHAIKSTTQKSRIFYNFKGFDDWFNNTKDVGVVCTSLLEQLPVLDKGNVT